MNHKKAITFFLRLFLTTALAGAAAYLIYRLDYIQGFTAVDNVAGAAPLFLLLCAAGTLAARIWTSCRKSPTVALTLSILSACFALLLFPAVTGNWYPLAKEFGNGGTAGHQPDAANTQLASLPKRASLLLSDPLPKLDGATALYPVYAAFAKAVYDPAAVRPEDVVCTNTPNAYRSIIAGDCGVIFAAGPSQKQKQAALDAGVSLVYTPIGREAFVFLAGSSNPIQGLTQQQLKNIYSGKTAHWKTLGWSEGGEIIAFQRPEGSGSQTGLQNFMGGLPVQKPRPLPDAALLGRGRMMEQVSVAYNGVQPALGYSYRYYATAMYPNPGAKLLAVDGVYPSNDTIADGTYPFSSYFYAVTNGQPTGNVKALIDWILSEEGQYLIEQTGYVRVGN